MSDVCVDFNGRTLSDFTRERIRNEVWRDTVVEFDAAINNAVRQVRNIRVGSSSTMRHGRASGLQSARRPPTGSCASSHRSTARMPNRQWSSTNPAACSVSARERAIRISSCICTDNGTWPPSRI